MPYLYPTRIAIRSTHLYALSVLMLGTACGDDVTSATGGSTSSGSTTSPGVTTEDIPGTTTDVADSSSTGDTPAESSSSSSSSTGDMADSSSGTTMMIDPTDPETSSSSSSSSTGDESSSSSSSGMEMTQECPYGDLPAPGAVSETTVDQDSEFGSSCGGNGAPDVSYTMTAPEDGLYIFSASAPIGSPVDPIIAIFDGTCGGPELDCNQDINQFTTDAEVSVALSEGQVVTVVGDGFSLAGGAIDISVTYFAGSCPDGDLGSVVPQTVNGTTVGGQNTAFASCGGDLAADDQLTFTAPTDGVYAFDTAGSDYDTLLFLLDGCGGDELGCNDNVEGGNSSHLNLLMTQDQQVVVGVDGAGADVGNYTLTIERDECPDVTLPSTAPQTVTGSTAGELDASAGSCGGNGAPGVSYSFTAPEAGIYTIDTDGSDFDTVLYTLDGCGGAELQCNNDGGAAGSSRLNVTLAAGEETLFVVDGANSEAGDFNVNIALDTCPDVDLGSDTPVALSGDTSSEIDASQPTCGFVNGAPDVAYTFTAAATGTYVFDTEGSPIDTVLYAYDGATCGGDELDCDDDGGVGFGDSLLILDLVQDQTITVIVDGYGSAVGEYNLNITAPACGNDIIELGEDCDGDNLGGASCFSEGLGGGTITCDETCSFDTTDCGQECGDGEIDVGEACDLSEIGTQSCGDFGFDGGSVDCGGDCEIDTSQCANGIVAICSTPGTGIDSAFPTTTDTITVPDMGTIADVDVFVDITHTFTGDLEMTLFADDLGTSNDLSFDDCGGNDDVWAFFNDEGSVATGTACIVPIGIEGNLIPDEPLSIYDGMASNGDWTLSVTDDAGGDTGTLNEWCIYITLE